MNLSPPLQYAMTQINRALMVGDSSALVSAIQEVDLAELLAQDTLEKVRARGKSALVIFLSTLACNNEVERDQAQFWLDCYQSISHKKLTPALQALAPDNVLVATLQCLIADSLSPVQNQSLNGASSQWKHAFELAIDHKRWALATALLDQASARHLKNKTRQEAWMFMAKSLAKRHELFVDSSGQTHVDVNYVQLANMYERCGRFFAELGQKQASFSLAFLQAKCLEAAKEFPAAIATLKRIAKSSPPDLHASLINQARCECKQGDIDQSIALLDEVVSNQLRRPVNLEDTTVLTGTAAPSQGKEFNISNASKALADLATVLRAHQIPFFLVSGTLLGYAREGQLLKHDKDIDVGILGWEQQYSIGMALQQSAQFTISTDFLKGQKVYYIPISHNETGFIIDLFFYHPLDGKYVTGVDFFFGHQQTFAFTPFELQETEFLGVPMYVPHDVDLKLQENFGNWRVSDPGYISHLEAPCTVDPGGKNHMLTARLQLINAINDKKALKIARVLRTMRKHQDSSWAMSPALIEKVEQKLSALNPTSGSGAVQAHVQEVAHVE